MANEYKLPFTGQEITEKLNKVSQLSEELNTLNEEVDNALEQLGNFKTGNVWYGTCNTQANSALIATTSTGDFTLNKGNVVFIKFLYGAIANSTLNIDGTGAKNIVTLGNTKLVDGEITSNETAVLIYDGSQFVLPDSSKATTGQYGITKLSSSTSSTSTSVAATASAVKSAYDLANAAIPKPSTAVGGDVLTYDEATSTWVALTPSGGGEPQLLRGPFIITKTQTFDLSILGIKVGDPINVICIGGGGGGGSNAFNDNDSNGAEWAIYNKGYGGGMQGKPKLNSGGTYAGRGAGGGSGYVTYKSIIVDNLSVPVTIGAGGGPGGASNSDYSPVQAPSGGTTSFGTYASASGGSGGWTANGKGTSSSSTVPGATAGAGGNNGESSSSATYSSMPSTACKGGIGFVYNGLFSVENADNAPNETTCTGAGCVMIWY